MFKNVLIVYAHHDPNSFAKAMLDRTVETLARQGYATRVSDLHAMAFKAVADDADFIEPHPGGGPGSGTDYQSRQRVASIEGVTRPTSWTNLTSSPGPMLSFFCFHFTGFMSRQSSRVGSTECSPTTAYIATTIQILAPTGVAASRASGL